jgi:hypothetical protein
MAVERALVALGLQNFPGPDPDSCGSDNLTILEILKSSSGYVGTNAKTSGSISTSASFTTLLLTLPLSSLSTKQAE